MAVRNPHPHPLPEGEGIAAICRIAPEGELGGYAVDGLKPQVVAFPDSPEQVATIVKLAAENRWAIIPRGGGTQMRLGGIPRAVDVVLCTTAMNRVLEYEPADLVVSVQAGVRLGELQRTLGQHGQLLALDPPLPEQATIGGIIAANASGPLRLRYGTCRDLLIGIKVVSADGSITKGGGKVVKNVTGYDMCKLYTNSLGTLGVIVEASFKLAPLPRIETTVLAWFGNLGQAYEAARAIHKSVLPVRACELLSSEVAASLGVAGSGLGRRDHLLAVWIGGGEAAVERQNRDVAALCSTADRTQVLRDQEVRRLWRGIEDFGREPPEIIARLSVLPSRAGELLARLPEGATFVSHLLSGVTHAFGAAPEALAPLVRDMEGYLVLEACPPDVKRRLDVWGPVGPDFRLMERIKREFDPNGILNPGRYIGGL
ncbi:MAG TPA: FAD-binding oxidoreductase [Chloroflexota bacterium]|nr:FAD-binding oxidoreductase [Chloroflexota bacterium]